MKCIKMLQFIACIIVSSLAIVALAPARKAMSRTAEQKKLLILDIINIEGKADYNYIEGMITNSIREMLAERFMFREVSRGAVMDTAGNNLLLREDFYTRSVAMNLGLLTRNDIVIGGGFFIRPRENQDTIVMKLFIGDLAKRRIISEIREEGPAGSRIFETIKQISDRMAGEAGKVLPGKDQWRRQGMAFVPEGQVVFGMGISPFAFPAGDKVTIGSGTDLAPGNFDSWYVLAGEYRRMNFTWNNFVLWGRMMINYGTGEFAVALNDKKAPADFMGIDGAVGPGYRVPFTLPIGIPAYLLAGAGAGLQAARLTHDYSDLDYPPMEGGKPITAHQENQWSPTVSANLALGVGITDTVIAELNTIYQYTFLPAPAGRVIFTIGAGYQW